MSSNLQQVQVVTVISLVLFSLLMVSIGIYSISKTKTIDGFLLGGRNIGAWVSAFAYGTSYFSAVIFIGYAGKHGWDIGFGSMWIGVGNAVLGCLLAWLILAKKTRAMTHKLNVKTMPEFFEARYRSTAMKVFAAAMIFIFLVPYSAAVYKGLGSMFNTIFPSIPVQTCMLIVAILTAIYLVLGGYVATAYTDFVQGIIMIFGVFAMVVAIVKNPAVGGIASGISKIRQINPDLVSPWGAGSWKFLCINILLTSFGTWGLPQMVGKYYAIKDEKSIRTATIVSTVFAAIIGCGAYFIGSLARLFLGNTLPQGGYDAVVPQMLLTALGDSNLITTIILAVILLLLLSASMSTLASVVLTSASAISVDLMPVVRKKYKKERQMYVTRILCFIFVALSYLFATMNIAIIVSIMSFSWGVVSGCFIGPYLWGIYSKNTTKAGAWAGMICGFLTVAISTAVISALFGFKAAVSMSPQMGVAAMAVSIIVVPAVSKVTKRFDSKHLEEVFEKAA
ncbi:MAG: sodium:solute symporter [Clostridia bacterium]|nr:sodium:solute symporter [Clostridia bacterium]